MKKHKTSGVITGFFVLIILASIFAVWDKGSSIFQIGSDRTDLDTFFGEIKEYSSGGASFPLGSIKEIEANWLAGDVQIKEYDGKEIIVFESADNEINKENQMKYLSKNGKLVIRYNGNTEEEYTNKIQKKKLELLIPKEEANFIKEIKLNIIAATTKVNTQGISDLKINSTNGQIDIEGKYKVIEIKGISGNVEMKLLECPKKLRAYIATGDIALKIPENGGFSVEYNIATGNFECDFPLTSKNSYAIYKKIKSSFELEVLSGDIKIEELN